MRRASKKLVRIGKRLPNRAHNSIREKIQSLEGSPCLFDVGRLGLEHQAGDVDRPWAFGPAELAMNAEICMCLEFVGSPEPRIDLAAGQHADQVGLRPRRRCFSP